MVAIAAVAHSKTRRFINIAIVMRRCFFCCTAFSPLHTPLLLLTCSRFIIRNEKLCGVVFAVVVVAVVVVVVAAAAAVVVGCGCCCSSLFFLALTCCCTLLSARAQSILVFISNGKRGARRHIENTGNSGER